jgi:DNA-directed RNA polymerase subunit RPC12/RpoP
METKICTKCGKELPITDFNWRNKAKGTRRSECKYCHSKYMKEAYAKKQKEIQDLKSQFKCAKCGDNRGYVLDFHHIDPSIKEEGVARMISNNYKLDKVYDEIKKCICLCANCHREFHYLEKEKQITLEEYLA